MTGKTPSPTLGDVAKKKITAKQRRFVQAYTGKAQGNATEAARIAGYKHPNQKGPELVKIGSIEKAIQEWAEANTVASVMDRTERQEMLSLIGRGGHELKDRIKSIDVLNKMDGLYVQKHELTVKASPQETEDAVIQMYRANPDVWKRIKKAVGKK